MQYSKLLVVVKMTRIFKICPDLKSIIIHFNAYIYIRNFFAEKS